MAIRYGKRVVLKNKTIRKQLMNKMNMDQAIIGKIERLAALQEKFTNRTKRATMAKFNQKIKSLQAIRKSNAEKCAQILA